MKNEQLGEKMKYPEMNVLIVDDDEDFLDFIQAELHSFGNFDVSRATSASQALDTVKSSERLFDCFLLDIDMPGMDGIELCRALREEIVTVGVPIIMVTVLTAVEKMDQAFEAGASDYINKPMVAMELRGRMRMAMAKLAEERARKSLISSVVSDAPISLSEGFRPFGRPSIVDRAAMENFAFRLGSIELCSRTLFGVCISNISDIYASKDGASFKTLLADISEVIIDSLGPGHKMLAYLGSGEFAVLSSQNATFEPKQLIEQLSIFLTVYAGRGRAMGEVIPEIKVGPPVVGELFSCAAPDELVCIATGLAHDIGQVIEHQVSSVAHVRLSSASDLAI